MRLKTTLQKEAKHSELVSCVGWTGPDEVYSAGDDHKILKWNLLNNESSVVSELNQDCYPTDMHWLPKSGASRKGNMSDVFALSTTDGKVMLITRAGRTEKVIEAHTGAVLCTRWNHAGTDLVTAGEDGLVKIWSRSGMLRSTLSQNSSPVYAVSWNPESDHVLFTAGKQLTVKPLQPNAKPNSWKAHDGVILKVDWNMVNNYIVSGGEDCKYKIWDSYGRQLYCSILQDYPITSIAWSPDGELFTVGSFNTLRLCDKTGWSHALDKPTTGSVFNIMWSSDGTQIAGACGNGQVIFGHLVEKRLEWKNFELLVTSNKLINVRNVTNDAREKLDFRDRIIKTSLGYKHLIVATSSQCYVYSVTNWNTPIIFDLKEGSVTLIAQSDKCFLLVDNTSIYVYSYEGRQICNPKFQGMRTDILNQSMISLSDDTIAIKDKTDDKAVQLFDTNTGKALGDGKPFQHKADVMEISLDKTGSPTERRIAIIDKNRDLFLVQVRVFGSARKSVKLSTMIQCMLWNAESNMLCGLSDDRLIVWYYPNTAYVDKYLLPRTVYECQISEFGRSPQLMSFTGTHLTIRRHDGALLTAGTSPYPSVLQQLVSSNKWEDAVRLCRFVKDECLWSCLAAMSAYHKHLDTAEVAYSAIDETSLYDVLTQSDKVQYIQHIRDLPQNESRTAAMAMFSGQSAEAEAILLQAGLVFRAIMLNLSLFNWDRALDLAVKYKTHVDTVLAHRQKFLNNFEKRENNTRFLQLNETVHVNWDDIEEKIQAEYEKEKSKAASK